jgi:hypothetical protein
MSNFSNNPLAQALKVLNDYYRALVTRIAEEIVENQDRFDADYPGGAEELIDRYGLHLHNVARVHADLMAVGVAVYGPQFVQTQGAGVPGDWPGMPVQPSGLPVGPDTPLEVGAAVLANWRGVWWRAQVVALEPGDLVRIHYVGWDSRWDETVPRSSLLLDTGESAGDR